jgi:two-component system sensor histidine kinase KdpD
MFVPFQRLGDTDNTTGVGLGLALSRGFTEAMGGTLTAEDTPGGGLTMVVSLPAAARPAGPDSYEPGHRERDADTPAASDTGTYPAESRAASDAGTFPESQAAGTAGAEPGGAAR